MPGKSTPLKPFMEPGRLEAGCDEAGRGCLAGPVVAAAVILPENIVLPGLNDSKKLSQKQRDALRPLIEQHALAWAVGVVAVAEIDEINILNAALLAMHRAVDALKLRPEHLLIDGNRFKPYAGTPHTCVIKGDGKLLSIAAASVLAKTHRDALMGDLHIQHPEYAWDRNAGYPTLAHREAIRQHGATVHHRTSFRLLPEQLTLF